VSTADEFDIDTFVQTLMDELNVGRATAETLIARAKLLDKGFLPIPLFGAEPPVYGSRSKRYHALTGWQNIEQVSFGELAMWAHTWPDSRNTGAITRRMPTLIIDTLNPDGASAVEDMARDRFEEAGRILVRFGQAPKRAIPFRAQVPFSKLTFAFADEHKLDILGAGQHVVFDGIHPDTRRPCSWFGGTPGEDAAYTDLPLIDAAGARELIESAARMLVDKFGFRTEAPARRAPHTPTRRLRPGVIVNGFTRDTAWRAARWRELQAHVSRPKPGMRNE
jgi:hypothetical protein